MKVMNDHRSKFSNLSSWKEKPEKNQGELFLWEIMQTGPREIRNDQSTIFQRILRFSRKIAINKRLELWQIVLYPV